MLEGNCGTSWLYLLLVTARLAVTPDIKVFTAIQAVRTHSLLPHPRATVTRASHTELVTTHAYGVFSLPDSDSYADSYSNSDSDSKG